MISNENAKGKAKFFAFASRTDTRTDTKGGAKEKDATEIGHIRKRAHPVTSESGRIQNRSHTEAGTPNGGCGRGSWLRPRRRRSLRQGC